MLSMYFAHYVSLGLYVLAIGLGILNIKKLFGLETRFKKFIAWYIMFAISTCFIFVILQVDWITSDYNEAVGDKTAYLWLLFDYLNALSYITGMVAINVSLDVYRVYVKRVNRKSRYSNTEMTVDEEIYQLHELIDTIKKDEPSKDDPSIITKV